MDRDKLLAAQGALKSGIIEHLGPSTSLNTVEYGLWQARMIERAEREFKLLCSYFEDNLQVVLHKNDVVPDAKKWLSDLEKGPQ